MRTFQKPTVTIDLEEYNELQDFKKRFASLKLVDYSVAITVLLRLASRGKDMWQLIDLVNSELDREGLVMVGSGLQVGDKMVCEIYKK